MCDLNGVNELVFMVEPKPMTESGIHHLLESWGLPWLHFWVTLESKLRQHISSFELRADG